MPNPVQSLKKVKGDRYYGKTAAQYEEVRKKQKWWAVEQKEMQALLDLLPRSLRVVDIPFGTGRFVPYYLERGYDVYGLDASSAMLQTANDLLGDQFQECKVTTGFSTALPFADNEFDLLVSTRFLRDIILFRDVKTTLQEFARVTSRFAILQMGIRREEPYEMPPDDERMSSRMSLEQTAEFLSGYGFELIESRQVKGSRDRTTEIRHILCKRR